MDICLTNQIHGFIIRPVCLGKGWQFEIDSILRDVINSYPPTEVTPMKFPLGYIDTLYDAANALYFAIRKANIKVATEEECWIKHSEGDIFESYFISIYKTKTNRFVEIRTQLRTTVWWKDGAGARHRNDTINYSTRIIPKYGHYWDVLDGNFDTELTNKPDPKKINYYGNEFNIEISDMFRFQEELLRNNIWFPGRKRRKP